MKEKFAEEDHVGRVTRAKLVAMQIKLGMEAELEKRDAPC